MKQLGAPEIIGLCLAVIAVVGVYASTPVMKKLMQGKDDSLINKYSLYVKIGSLVLATAAFLLVIIF